MSPLTNLFKRTKTEMDILNKEYEEMSKRNKLKSRSIGHSIQQKSERFNQMKEKRSNSFDSIRNK